MKVENKNEKEEIKAKKIRRILLLKIDGELKSDSTKNLNIMINSKRIQDLNKEYNSYKILLSEASKIYSNYVEIVDKSYPKNTRQIKIKKDFPRKQKEEQTVKSLNSSFESQNLILDYIPSKIDLGEKKIIPKRRGPYKNLNSPDFFNDINSKRGSKTNADIINKANKSTKLGNKGIVKVIDKIIRLKLQAEAEDDNIITKSIIKLRNYCYKLIKKKKKYKKASNLKSQFSPQKQPKEKETKKQKYKKRKTIVGLNPFIQKSLLGLFENNKEPKINRKETYKKLTRFAIPEINEKNIEDIEKNNTKSKSIKANKISSFKESKSLKEKEKEKEKDNINSNKKRKIRRVQTMNMKTIEADLIKIQKNKKRESKKNVNNLNFINYISKEPLTSSKLSRPPGLIIINNNNIIFKKKNSLLDNKIIKDKKEKTIFKNNNKDNKEQDKKRKNKDRKSFMRNIKYNANLFTTSSKKFKMIPENE